jgi:hypothetical protein
MTSEVLWVLTAVEKCTGWRPNSAPLWRLNYAPLPEKKSLLNLPFFGRFKKPFAEDKFYEVLRRARL